METKIRGFIFTAVTIFFFCVSSSPTVQGASIYDATIQGSCAPWDGAAYSVSVNLDTGKFNASIIGKGLSIFKAGRKVVLDGNLSNDNNTGAAFLCQSDSNCTRFPAGDVIVDIPPSVIGSDKMMQGTLTIHGAVIPLRVHFDPTIELCG